jgi:hypothetical protein
MTEQNEKTAKGILEFPLPECQEDFETAVNGYKWKLAMWDLDQWLRSELKYKETYKENEYELLEKFRDKLHEFKNEYSLSFD